MSDRRRWALEGDIREALDNFLGGQVSGPWDPVIEELASILDEGRLNLDRAARLDLLLARAAGVGPDTCDVCDQVLR